MSRPGRVTLLVVASALTVVASMAPPVVGPAAALADVVEVRNNFFDPQTIRVAPGATVRWAVLDGGHTVTADDGRFDFPDEGTLADGESVAWTAGTDEVVRYRCRVHANEGMVGSIVVGRGGPPPPPDDAPVLHVPSTAYPTIAAAVASASPGSVVRIAAGRYDEAVEVTTPSLIIEGEDRDAVILDGAYRRDVGLSVRADGVLVRNLTVRRFLTAGVAGAGARIDAVAAVENEGVGIDVGTGALVGDAVALRNGIGVRAAGSGFVVRRSHVEGNATGIAVRGDADAATVSFGGDVIGNTVVADGAAPPGRRLSVPTGVGIWVAGGAGVRVTENSVRGARLGIVVAGRPPSARGVQVVNNTVDGSAVADLAYDGFGLDTCFAGNARSDGSYPTAEPAVLTVASDCQRPHTVGVPHPLVHAWLWAT